MLFRSHDLIPYRRLQSVGVSSGPLERRLFGIWSVRLSTAGTSSGLNEFPGLVDPRPYADFLLAKARLSDAYTLVANEAVQMHGGIGMTDEHEIGFFMKRARAAEMTFGDAAFHRDRFAKLSGY